MKIWIVDEDIAKANVYSDILDIEGIDSTVIPNADKFMKMLEEESPPDLMIVDVMLGVSDEKSSFTRSETENFLKTGIISICRIEQKYGSQTVKKCVFWSNASKDTLIAEIKATSSRCKIPFWPKWDVLDPDVFLSNIKSRVKTLSDEYNSEGVE